MIPAVAIGQTGRAVGQETAPPRRSEPSGNQGDGVRRLFLIVTVALGTVFGIAGGAHAAFTPNGVEYHPLTFPVQEAVHYTDDFGGARHHPGNDLMGRRLLHELAANDGTITFA